MWDSVNLCFCDIGVHYNFCSQFYWDHNLQLEMSSSTRLSIHLRGLSNVEVGLLFGFTQLSKMENHQLILLLVWPWLQPLQTRTHKYSKHKLKKQTNTALMQMRHRLKYTVSNNLSPNTVNISLIFRGIKACFFWVEPNLTWTRSKISACSLSVSWERYFWMASFALGG